MRPSAINRRLSALVTVIFVAGCSGQSGTSAPQAPQLAGPSTKRTGSLNFTVYTAGQTPGFLAGASAVDLAVGPAGDMWFTDSATPAIGRIATDGTVTEFTSGLASGAKPYSIVAGPDGNMWFSDNSSVALGKITPGGTITEYSAPQYTNSKAVGIAFGPNGEPWVVGFGSQPLLAHLTQGTIEAQLLPVAMTPNGALIADSQGNLFFVAQNGHRRAELIERRAVGGGVHRTYVGMHAIFEPCCPNVAAKSIVMGADGNPWFTTLDFGRHISAANFLGTLKSGKVHLTRIKHKGLSEPAYPSGLAATTNGLWITGGDPLEYKGALWHVDTTGKQIGYDLPYDPLSLTADANGNPWFTTHFSGTPSTIVEVTGAR
jgi:streptogramin lyase